MINLQTKTWAIENIETVLFDKDGTFIDLHYFWGKMTELRVLEVINYFKLDNNLFSSICLFLGYDINTKKMLSDGITAMYSRPIIIEKFCEKLKDLNVETSNSVIEKIFDKVSIKFYKNIQDYTKPIDEAINFIKELKNLGVKLGIVTSDSVVSTELTLKQFGWEDLFQVVIGRESSNETKESGTPTKLALECLEANPETTIMIGDAPMDYISAKNAGIEKTILVSTGQISGEDLKKTSSYVVDSLKDIKCLMK